MLDNILNEIELFFEKGFVADESLEHYIASAHGIESIVDLRGLSSEELEELLAPFVVPSFELTISIEKYIPANGLKSDELYRALNIPDAIGFEIFSEIIMLPLTQDVIKVFIDKLRLDKDLSFINIGDENQDITNLCKREIRHSSSVINKMQQIEINIFIDKISSASDVYKESTAELTKLLLLLWSEYPGDETMSLIYNKKNLIQRQLDAVKNFEESYASKYSMDYLMMNRLTPPPIDKEEREKLMKNLDRLSVLLFDRVLSFHLDEKELPEIKRGDKESVKKIIDFFSGGGF